MENMVHIQAPEHPKFVIRERAGGYGALFVVWNDESGVLNEG